MYYSTSKEMGKLDKLAVENGLEIRQMMELAGWHIVPVFGELNIPKSKKVLVVCGKGNKGGDGLSAARHLHNHGYDVGVLLITEDIKPDARHHLELLKKMNIPIFLLSSIENKIREIILEYDMVVDALLGYNLDGNPRGNFELLINLINSNSKYVVAYDIPSGIDATTGKCMEPCIVASATITLALPKKCFQLKSGKKKSGIVFLTDIGIPKFLYDKISLGSRPDFGYNGFIKL